MTRTPSPRPPRRWRLEDLPPRQIVAELDKYVVGQRAAKRAVAVALRNRWRRQQLPPEVAEEILPKNILMIGPTGVGKTEIARRLAKLARAPFLKVEASKFTEVGYVGRDVESMIRDLAEIGVAMVREEKRARRWSAPPPSAPRSGCSSSWCRARPPGICRSARARTRAATREKLRERLRAGTLDARLVEIEVEDVSLPELRDVHAAGRRGGGHQPQGHDARPLRPPPPAAHDGRRGARRASSARRPTS